MQFKFVSLPTPPADDLLVPIYASNPSPDTYALLSEWSGIPAALIEKGFGAEYKESHVLYGNTTAPFRRIFLLGLGDNPGFRELLTASRSFFRRQRHQLGAALTVHWPPGMPEEQLPRWIDATINGCLLAGYDIGHYKTTGKDKKTAPLDSVGLVLPHPPGPLHEYALRKGQAAAETMAEILQLVNAPANRTTPQFLADWAAAAGQQHGFRVQVLDKPQLETMGFDALLAVGRGSEPPPLLIIMEYAPSDATDAPCIGLVGKGVTFDTGGLSIKPSANLHYMKSDMGGAAAVLGTVALAAKLRLPVRLVAAIPATENSVDALSIRPGDVIGSYSGKTIEVIDTDAEGRLILADALSYLTQTFAMDVVIDLATLTGSCIRALGTYAAGLFTNNDRLADQLLAAGTATGEKLWRLPLWPEYRQELNSDIADIKNLSSNPAGGAITAAKFLEEFIRDHTAWAHLDIAGTALADSEFTSQKSATGYGIRLLLHFLEHASNNPE